MALFHASGGARPRVVVADEGQPSSRSALAAVRALALAGYAPLATVSGRRTLAATSRRCAGTVRVPPEGVGWLRAVTALGVPVVPASDQACLALGLPGSGLVDKREVALRARTVGLAVPGEQVFATAREVVDADVGYPCVVKPAVRGSALPGAVRLEDRAAAARLRGDEAVVVQPQLRGPMLAVSGVLHEGRLLAAVHQRYVSTWPLECGVASRAVTVPPDPALEERVIQLLDGLEGVFQVQLLAGAVLDVNPRVYGSLALAVRAGANLPAVWCDALRGEVPDRVVRAVPGTPYRWVEGEVRGAWAGRRSPLQGASAALAQAVPRLGVADGVLDPHDLRPAVRRLALAAGVR